MIYKRFYQRELATLTIGIFVVLLAVITTTLMVRLLGMAATGKIATEAVLITLAFSALRYLPILLSLSLYIAVLLALSRGFRDHEMEVWMSSGLSIAEWVKPTLTFATPLVVLIAVLSFVLSPWAVRKSNDYRHKLMAQEETAAISPGLFKEAKNDNRVYVIENFSGEHGSATNIFVQTEKQQKLGIISAHHGQIVTDDDGNRHLQMYNGRRYEGRPGQREYRIVEFDRYSLLIQPKDPGKEDTPTNGKTTGQLLKHPNADNLAEFSWRLAAPIGAVLMTLLAVPLSFSRPRAGRSLNMVMALLAYLIYSNFISVGNAWMAQGKLPASVGLWPIHATLLAVVMALLAYQAGAFRHKAAQ